MADQFSLASCYLCDLLMGIRSIFARRADREEACQQCQRLWWDVSKSIRPALLLAADRYVLRKHITALTAEDAVSHVLGGLVKVVQDPAGAPILDEDAVFLAKLIHQAKVFLATARRWKARHGEVALPYVVVFVPRGSAPLEVVADADSLDFLIRKVRLKEGPNPRVVSSCFRSVIPFRRFRNKSVFRRGLSTAVWRKPLQ